MADAAKTLLGTLKQAFQAEPCDLAKCEEQLTQLKLLVFSSLNPAAASPAEQELAREMLELACYLSIRRKEMTAFERNVAQLKMYYSENKATAAASKFPILGLYLLHLLASDRIGEFHTELELIPVDDCKNTFIKQPIQLERYLMEGNYAKVLEAQKDMPQMYYSFFMERLIDTVRLK